MPPESIDPTLNAVDDKVETMARAAYRQFTGLLAKGVKPQKAMEQVRATFDPKYFDEIASVFGSLLDERWTADMVKRYEVGRVTLSRLMHRNWQEAESAVTGIVNQHLKGIQQARVLAGQLYTGYGLLAKEPLRWSGDQMALLPKALRELVKDPVVRGVLSAAARKAATARIRTTALRSAYEQALKSDLTLAGRARLDSMLKVAMEEKLRYFASRIAQTELARVHAISRGQELMADQTISVVQWRLSGNHPREDICDLFANVDNYGLGPGCYPKELAPRPIAHPFCRCRLRSRPDLQASNARFDPGAERAYLAKLGKRQAARVAGSQSKLLDIEGGARALDVLNEGKQAAFKVPLLGSAAPSVPVVAAPKKPEPVAAPPLPPPAGSGLPAFVAQKTVAAASKFAEQIIAARGAVDYVKGSAGEELVRFKHVGVKRSFTYTADAAAKLYGKARLAGMEIEAANVVNEWLIEAAKYADSIGIPRLRSVTSASGSRALASMGDGVLAVSKRATVTVGRRMPALMEQRTAKAIEYGKARPGNGVAVPANALDYFSNEVESLRSVLWHEFGHHVHQQFKVTSRAEYLGAAGRNTTELESRLRALIAERRAKGEVFLPSRYANTNMKEFFAENFSLYKMGRRELISPWVVDVIQKIEQGIMP